MRDSENLWTERAALVHSEERESARAPGNVRADLREARNWRGLEEHSVCIQRRCARGHFGCLKEHHGFNC